MTSTPTAPEIKPTQHHQVAFKRFCTLAGCSLRPEWVFLVLFLITSIFTAISIPVGAGYDEPSHIARSIQLSQGQLLPNSISEPNTPELQKLYGGPIDTALSQTMQENMQRFHTTQDRYTFPVWSDPETGGNTTFSGQTSNFTFSNTVVYSPITYFPQILAVWVGTLVTNNITIFILIIRLFGILFLAGTIFCCIYYIPIGKWFLTTIALLPGCIAVNACVSADITTFAVTTAFITSLLCALYSKQAYISKLNWAALSISGISLGLVKITYLPLLCLIFLLVIKRSDQRRQTIVKAGLIFTIGTILFLIWYLLVHHVNTGFMYGRATDSNAQIAFILQHPTEYAGMLITEFFKHNYFMFGYSGLISYRQTTMPSSGWVTAIALICATLASIAQESRAQETLRQYRKHIFASFYATSIIIFLLIETADYLQFTEVGAPAIDGVQERYFLPLLMLILLPLLLTVSNINTKSKTDNSRLISHQHNDMPIISFELLQSIGYILSAIFAIYL